MNKDLEFYKSLNYPIRITKIASDEGGGYLAEIPDLPGCMSDGETIDLAIENLRMAQRKWLAVAMKRGQSIPLPKTDDEEYSGKFTLRVPRSLHRELARKAKDEGVSLNQYLLSLLSYGFGVRTSWSAPSFSARPITAHESTATYDNQGEEETAQRPSKRHTQTSNSRPTTRQGQ